MVQLREIAHARSGDKGDIANVGIIASAPEYYPLLERYLTAERVEAYVGDFCEGPVERYAMPNIHAFNFLLHGALDGGGRESLRVDEIGKTYSGALLRLDLDILDDDLPADIVADT